MPVNRYSSTYDCWLIVEKTLFNKDGTSEWAFGKTDQGKMWAKYTPDKPSSPVYYGEADTIALAICEAVLGENGPS